MKYRTFPIVLAVASLLSACETASIKTDVAAQKTATSCCSSESTLPAPRGFSEKIELAFESATTHFDFGHGLTPFVQVAVDPKRAKYMALLSHPRTSPSFLGGSGTLHYVDLRPIFISSAGKRLPEPALTPPMMRTYGVMGTYMYVRYAEIPAEAASVIVIANSTDVGKKGQIQGRVPGGGYMLGSTFIPMLGGNQRIDYTLAPYGELVLLFSPNAPT